MRTARRDDLRSRFRRARAARANLETKTAAELSPAAGVHSTSRQLALSQLSSAQSRNCAVATSGRRPP